MGPSHVWEGRQDLPWTELPPQLNNIFQKFLPNSPLFDKNDKFGLEKARERAQVQKRKLANQEMYGNEDGFFISQISQGEDLEKESSKSEKMRRIMETLNIPESSTHIGNWSDSPVSSPDRLVSTKNVSSGQKLPPIKITGKYFSPQITIEDECTPAVSSRTGKFFDPLPTKQNIQQRRLPIRKDIPSRKAERNRKATSPAIASIEDLIRSGVRSAGGSNSQNFTAQTVPRPRNECSSPVITIEDDVSVCSSGPSEESCSSKDSNDIQICDVSSMTEESQVHAVQEATLGLPMQVVYKRIKIIKCYVCGKNFGRKEDHIRHHLKNHFTDKDDQIYMASVAEIRFIDQ
jgi:hypothetical protein